MSSSKRKNHGADKPGADGIPASLRTINEAAYQLFLAEGGGDLEALMENGQRTAAAYQSQIRAAQEGGQGWGPTVTPYEDRMTRSLQLRLIKERRAWLEDCRERIEAAVEREQQGAGNKPTPEPDKPEAEAPEYAEIREIAQSSFAKMVDTMPELVEMGYFRELPDGGFEYTGPEFNELADADAVPAAVGSEGLP